MPNYLLYNEIPERLGLYEIDPDVITTEELELINGHCVNGDDPTTEKDLILAKIWKYLENLEPLKFPCGVSGVIYVVEFIM